jgi:hypothetical protein
MNAVCNLCWIRGHIEDTCPDCHGTGKATIKTAADLGSVVTPMYLTAWQAEALKANGLDPDTEARRLGFDGIEIYATPKATK